jgi:hypothetical protein
MTARRLFLALLCTVACSSGAIVDARTATPKVYVPDAERTIEGGRKVLILVHSVHESDDNPFSRSVLRQQKPLREVFPADNFEERIPAALKSVVEPVPWIGAHDIETSANVQWRHVEQVLDASNSHQLLLLRPEHVLDSDFHTLRVTLRATLLDRQIPRGKTSDSRFTQDWTPYQLEFVVEISPPVAIARSRGTRREFWAVDGGRRVHAAIEQGIEWIAARFSTTLNETEQQSLAWRNRGDHGGNLPDGSPGWLLDRTEHGWVGFESRRRRLIYVGTATL